MNSANTRYSTLITVLLLLFLYPLGIIAMIWWTGWKWWIKALVIIVGVLFYTGVGIGIKQGLAAQH